MEICKRRVNMYDTVNQSKTPFITHVAPSTSTNLTMTFNNQLNTVHSQVNLQTNSPISVWPRAAFPSGRSRATKCERGNGFQLRFGAISTVCSGASRAGKTLGRE